MTKKTNRRVAGGGNVCKPVSVSMTLAALVPLCSAILASSMMSAHHIWAIGLPGCGPGGGCDWAMRSQWGNLFGMPTAFIGVGYFTALTVIWLGTARNGLWRPILYLARLGALASIGFSILMLVLGHFCIWCLITHIANLTWYVLCEVSAGKYRSRSTVPVSAVAVGITIFLVLSISMKLFDMREVKRAVRAAQKAAEESIAKIGTEAPAALDTNISDASRSTDTPSTPKKARRVFGGRYWTGAEDAAVRIVIFHDYRCQLCKEVEERIDQFMASRRDVALSIKQWPFDGECNSTILGENVHPGACTAARYAEAAGLVGGDSAFWRVHRWIMGNNGEVTEQRFQAFAAQLGLDWAQLRQSAQSGVVDSILSADIQDGLRFGIKFTPMVFINGYELQGWQSAGAIPAAVERAAEFARNNPRRDDRPEEATEREFNQWLAQPMTRMQIRKDDHVRGPLGAPAAVIMYGDISEPYNSAALDLLLPLIEDTSRVCFIFRVFPLQAECNDMVKRKINDRACEAARTLEASGIVGGAPAYWQALRWIIGRRGSLPDSLLAAVASSVGIDADQLVRSMGTASIDTYIAANVESARELGVNTSPTIFVNGRKIANWRTPGLLKRIISYLAGN